MENFQQYLENNWPRERRSQIAASATEDQVRAVLRKDYLQPADFLTLLSPAAAPLLEQMAQVDDFRLMLMPDHYTLLSTRTHDATPVPVAVYDSRNAGRARPFTERLCANEPVMERSDALMRALFRAG